MFGLSLPETAVILLVALLVLGPKEIPTVVRGIRKAMQALGGMATDFRKSLDAVAAEVGVDTDLKAEAEKINREVKQIIDLEGQSRDAYDISDMLQTRHKQRNTDDNPDGQ